jgi:hypothetical protein
MASSLFKQFKTDAKLETEGVTFEIADSRITMARAGVGNPAYATSMTKRTQAVRRQLARNELTPEQEVEILRQVYADSIVTNWEVRDGEGWRQGIPAEDGSVRAYNRDNVVKILAELPELFLELQSLASNFQNYRAEVLESDAKN